MSSPDDSWLYRCLHAVIRKVLSSLDARRAIKTNRGRRAASIVRRSSPRTVEAARRPQFVLTACRASDEDKTLRSTACRHQDSQESSGDDKMAPYRVRARAPSSGSPAVLLLLFSLLFFSPPPLLSSPPSLLLLFSSSLLLSFSPPHGSIRALDLRRNITKTRPFSSTHTPATSHTTRTSHSADSTRSGSG